jgi:hypothetical protein
LDRACIHGIGVARYPMTPNGSESDVMKRLLRGCMFVALGAVLIAPGCGGDNEKEAGITGKGNSSAPAADYLNSAPGKTTKLQSSSGEAYRGSGGASKSAEQPKPKAAEAPKTKAAEAPTK